MIAAMVKNDIVVNVIVADEQSLAALEEAFECELVDARPHGLCIGDLRTTQGWTRNAGGEQMVLPLLDEEQYDGYTLAMQRADAAEQSAAALEAEMAAYDAAYLEGVQEA